MYSIIDARNLEGYRVKVDLKPVRNQHVDGVIDATCERSPACVVMFPTQNLWYLSSNRDHFVTKMGEDVHQHGSNRPLAVSLIATPRQKMVKQ